MAETPSGGKRPGLENALLDVRRLDSRMLIQQPLPPPSLPRIPSSTKRIHRGSFEWLAKYKRYVFGITHATDRRRSSNNVSFHRNRALRGFRCTAEGIWSADGRKGPMHIATILHGDLASNKCRF